MIQIELKLNARLLKFKDLYTACNIYEVAFEFLEIYPHLNLTKLLVKLHLEYIRNTKT